MPFFMFVFASVLTLVLGHVATGYHRIAAEAANPHVEQDPTQASWHALAMYSFRGSILVLPFGLLVTAVLIVYGAYVASFQIVESGALAILFLDSDEMTTDFSLVTLGMLMTVGRGA